MAGWGPSEVRYTVYPGAPYIVAPARRGLRFSREELMHILLACGALIFAFTMAFVSPLYGTYRGGTIGVVLVVAGSTVAVLTGFLLHELMHKALAQRYGAWAEFRSNRMGLVLAVITGFLGIVFAAPGAVYIAGNLDVNRNGKVSLVGPATNLAIGSGFLIAAFGVGTLPVGGPADIVYPILVLVAYINIFLGGFNLLPIPPLDGSKVFRWNKAIWVAAIALVVAVYLIGWWVGVLPAIF